MAAPNHLSRSGGYNGYYENNNDTTTGYNGLCGDRLSRSGGYTGYSWSETGGLLRSSGYGSCGYGGYGGSGLTCSGELRSYGAIGRQGQSIMLTKFDVKLFNHTLQPTDSLQGLAVKYGVTVSSVGFIHST